MGDDNLSNQFLKFLRDDVEKKLQEVRGLVDKQSEDFYTKDKESQESFNKFKNDLNNKISLEINKIEGRLDQIDGVLRGNGVVGYSEHIRGLRRGQRALWVCIIFLAGFKVFGVSFEEWLQDTFFNNQKIQLVAPQQPSQTDNIQATPKNKQGNKAQNPENNASNNNSRP